MEIFTVSISQKTILLRCQLSSSRSVDSTQCQTESHQNSLVENSKLILKFIWKCKRPRIIKTTWKEKSKVEGLTVIDFKPYETTVIKKLWYYHKYTNRSKELKKRVQEYIHSDTDNWSST